MKSYLKLLFKCNTNRGVFTGYLAERVECGPSNHVVGGSIPCTVTFFFSFFFFFFFLIFYFFSKKKNFKKKKVRRIPCLMISHKRSLTRFFSSPPHPWILLNLATYRNLTTCVARQGWNSDPEGVIAIGVRCRTALICSLSVERTFFFFFCLQEGPFFLGSGRLRDFRQS